MFGAAAVKINKNALRTHTQESQRSCEKSLGAQGEKDATENDQVQEF